MNPYDVIFVGLSFDIAGGFALASGFMLKRPTDTFRESRNYYGYNLFLIKSSMLQRAEAWAGALLLALGFVLQMYGYFHGGVTAKDFGIINSEVRLLELLLVVGLLSTLWVLGWRHVAKRKFRRFQAQLYDPAMPPISPRPEDPDHLDSMASLMGASRLDAESEEAFAKRLTAIRAESYQRKTERSRRGLKP